MYITAMRKNQPIWPTVVALTKPSAMVKCMVGTTPLRPSPRNTPGQTDGARQARRRPCCPALTQVPFL